VTYWTFSPDSETRVTTSPTSAVGVVRPGVAAECGANDGGGFGIRSTGTQTPCSSGPAVAHRGRPFRDADAGDRRAALLPGVTVRLDAEDGRLFGASWSTSVDGEPRASFSSSASISGVEMSGESIPASARRAALVGTGVVEDGDARSCAKKSASVRSATPWTRPPDASSLPSMLLARFKLAK
jgi:hypothetical protein